MTRKFDKKEKMQIILFTLSIAITIFGIMFILTAAELVPIFKGFYKIENILGRYIIVILTMSTGIMLFSNVTLGVEKKRVRNTLTLGVTIFSTVLTLPLVYVFVAIFFAENNLIGPVGEAMMISQISGGFNAWFGSGFVLYLIYIFMLILSIVFICVPLLTGTLALKGKTLKVGKQENGRFGIGTTTLPVLVKKSK